MSIKLRRIHWTKGVEGVSDPVVTIEVTGWHDAYRFANHLTTGQCEFADKGHRIIRRLKARAGKDRWDWLMRYMHGDGGFR